MFTIEYVVRIVAAKDANRYVTSFRRLCSACGLERNDEDAVFYKRCGTRI
jgi:hypothetical protein